jgi:hypothetical protein
LIVAKKTVEEIAGGKPKSTLKEGEKHHNLFSIGCWDVLPIGRPPLEHCAICKEAIFHQFEDLVFIHDGLLKHLWTGGGHGEVKERSKRKIKEGVRSEMCARRKRVAVLMRVI